jgi:hypothetical protein
MDNVPRPRRHGAVQEVACDPASTNALDSSGVRVQCRTQPSGAARGWEGRVEPVVSGQTTHVHALEELLAFVSRVLTDMPTPS